MFTDREIELVRTTWSEASKDPAAAAGLFYGRLFEVAPDVKPLFTADIKEQGIKLMQMIGIAVNNMEKIDAIVPALVQLAERHDDYGALPEHYPVVGQVLLETLGKALGESFSAEAEEAWAKTYGALATAMLER
ncbi:MAG: globin domain-containing protein [Myxococcota bacterium]